MDGSDEHRGERPAGPSALDLRVLRYLIAVAEHGTVTAAARQLRVAQPSVSRQLRAMERTLGFDVFQRTAQGVRFTAAGTEYVERARELLRHADSLAGAADQLASGLAHRLALAASTALLDDVVAPFIAAELTDDDPYLAFVPTSTRERFAALERDADVAIATFRPSVRHRARPLGPVRMTAQVPPGHRLAGPPSLPLRALAGERIFILARSTRTRALLDDAPAAVRAAQITECTTAGMAQSLAAAGRGIAVVNDRPRFGLVPIPLRDDTGPIQVDAWVAWNAGHYADAQITDIADRMAAFFKRQVAGADG